MVEGAPPARVVARRALELAVPPTVWEVRGRTLSPAEPAGAPQPAAIPDAVVYPPPATRRGGQDEDHIELLHAYGAEPVVEHGVLRGVVLGLEVARVTEGRLEVGVGRHDRRARVELGGDLDPGAALRDAVAVVVARRRLGAAPHPANTLARSRWLRAVVCGRPDLAGAAALTPADPPLPLVEIMDNGAVPCQGTDRMGGPLVVVCSTGLDLDLVPTAADCRRILCPDAALRIVVPEGDDYPVTRFLSSTLRRPADVCTVPRSWPGLAPT
jgi:hypothetical protein